MAAGDVLLFSRKTTAATFRADPLGTLMTALIHLTTRSQWNHAALMVDDRHYLEATARGVVKSRLPVSDDVIEECAAEGGVARICNPDGEVIQRISVPYDDEDDRWDAVALADAYEGVRYGYFNAFMCGVNNVLAGLNLAIKRTDSVICSELVALALSQAGINVKRDASQVSPGDLATHFGVPR